ncbi:MAG: T9SS type A sorting domain-containing protein [Bacteroidetes bacterium]|nr:T9SS type A sorting domain-containing protein [Bacteroidota bacterium]
MMVLNLQGILHKLWKHKLTGFHSQGKRITWMQQTGMMKTMGSRRQQHGKLGMNQYNDASTGLATPKELIDNPIRVFSNPTSSMLNIVFAEEIQEPTEGEIYDLNEKLIYIFSRKSTGHRFALNLNNQGIKSGYYFIDIKTAKGLNYRKKFVVL